MSKECQEAYDALASLERLVAKLPPQQKTIMTLMIAANRALVDQRCAATKTSSALPA